MCFSAEASFIAAAGLTALSVPGLRRAQGWAQWLLALVPLGFALQQTIEGVIWLNMPDPPPGWLRDAYLAFAMVIWPCVIPLMAWGLQPAGMLRTLMLPLIGLGLALAAYQASIVWGAGFRVSVCMGCGGSLIYATDYPLLRWHDVAYLLIITAPLLLSSHTALRLFGVVVAAAFAFTLHMYGLKVFISVWCFFGACASAIIALWFWRPHLRHTTPPPVR